MLFKPNELKYDRIYDAQPMKGVCLFGGNFDPRDYSIVYCGAYFHNLYRLEEDGKGGYKGVLQKEFIDKCLQNIADSGRTTVFRPVAAEGNHKFDPILAKVLEDAGQMYTNRWNQKYPNWDNDFLHECFLDFIKQFGEAFDGDPRLLCVQIGLYGSFGEWNYCGVMPEHQALITMSAEKQEALVAQYCKYFKKTKLQHRNPTMGNSPAYPVGFHDDNFVFNSAEYHTPTWDEMIDRATICDGAVEGEWYELHQFDDFFREMPALTAEPEVTAKEPAPEKKDALVEEKEQSRFARMRQLNALRLQMKKAVHKEDFEEAARLRDEIRTLEKEEN